VKLKVIVKVPGHPNAGNVREQLIQRFKLDATDVLELALEHWSLVEDQDDEVLHAALEQSLAFDRRIARQIDRGLPYADFVELVRLLTAALYQIHEVLQPILHPIVAPRWYQPVDYRLARYIGMDAAAVIEIEPR
jgi:hypothetical protein